MLEQPTILIVDDEPMARDLLEGFLFNEGYNLIFAKSGAEALTILDDTPPDVILLDIMMPDMNGFDVCDCVKRSKAWRHIPIILVTALGGKEDLARGLEAGADDFLHKPVNKLELQARVRSMLRIKKQYDDLQASMGLREDLARMLVHDIRNPLAIIVTYSGVLANKENISAEIVRDAFKKINKQAMQLDTYLNDMLIVAKMEAGQFILNHSKVDINQLVQKLVDSYKVVAETKKIALVADVPSMSLALSLDKNLFQRVLDNLISNALKFSPPDTTVTVRVDYAAEAAERQICIQVLDQGSGIPEEHRQRIFDKFEIVTLKRQSVPQVGLGLAFCKTVVEAHGGQIGVKPNEPVGTIFELEI